MLTLPIKKKWFDMIKSGEKKEEYREIKPYYTTRFTRNLPTLDYTIIGTHSKGKTLLSSFPIILRNGYSKNSPSIKCNVVLEVNYGVEEWGAEPNKLYYVLKILSVEKVGDDNE